jgi:hypothetical protein
VRACVPAAYRWCHTYHNVDVHVGQAGQFGDVRGARRAQVIFVDVQAGQQAGQLAGEFDNVRGGVFSQVVEADVQAGQAGLTCQGY